MNSVDSFSSETLKIKYAIDDYPELLAKREVKSVGMLVITSNKGLAGAYNANVVRDTIKRIKDYYSQGVDVKLLLWDKKGFLHFAKNVCN